MTEPFQRPEFAELYDAFPFAADVSAYTELAARAGGPVLELGCGTGRLLVPLARAGHEVVGVDNSAVMLDRARQRLGAAGLGDAVELVAGDMREFVLPRRFRLAIVPTKNFFYLLAVDDQLRALRAIAAHLEPGGLLALDLLHPTPEWLSRPPGTVRQDVAGRLTGSTVLRTETVVASDPATQQRTMRSRYDVVAADATLRVHIVEWSLRYAYRYEIEHLLARCGFEVDSVAGGYDGRPLTADSPVLFVVARRRAGSASSA